LLFIDIVVTLSSKNHWVNNRIFAQSYGNIPIPSDKKEE